MYDMSSSEYISATSSGMPGKLVMLTDALETLTEPQSPKRAKISVHKDKKVVELKRRALSDCHFCTHCYLVM